MLIIFSFFLIKAIHHCDWHTNFDIMRIALIEGIIQSILE